MNASSSGESNTTNVITLKATSSHGDIEEKATLQLAPSSSTNEQQQLVNDGYQVHTLAARTIIRELEIMAEQYVPTTVLSRRTVTMITLRIMHPHHIVLSWSFLFVPSHSAKGDELKAIKARILELGLRYHIASSMTSFVAVEQRDEPTEETMVEAVPGRQTYRIYINIHTHMCACSGYIGDADQSHTQYVHYTQYTTFLKQIRSCVQVVLRLRRKAPWSRYLGMYYNKNRTYHITVLNNVTIWYDDIIHSLNFIMYTYFNIYIYIYYLVVLEWTTSCWLMSRRWVLESIQAMVYINP